MAAGTLPGPGTKYGPCSGPCVHIDCEETRAWSASACRLCGNPIGYDVRFCEDPECSQEGPEAFVHALCLGRKSD